MQRMGSQKRPSGPRSVAGEIQMSKRIAWVRLFFAVNMGALLFGLSWPIVLGMYWLPLVYLAPMTFGARSFLRWAHHTPMEATLDGRNAMVSVFVSWLILSVAFALLDGLEIRTVVLSLFASVVTVGMVALSLWFIGYYRVPRRRIATSVGEAT